MNFKILYWNIQGYSSKLHNLKLKNDFLEIIKDYDFVGITETWLCKDEAVVLSNSVPGYTGYFVSRGGTNCRGGVGFLVKDKFSGKVSVVKERFGDYLWLKLQTCRDTIQKDLYIGVCYIPPTNSDIWNKKNYHPFDVLSNDIMKFQSSGYVIIGGDFNSRTGNMSDCLGSSCTETACSYPPGSEQMLSKGNMHRNNCDKTVNVFGRNLLDMCKSTDMRIVNGRTLGDFYGNLTFYNIVGSSTVDYVLVQNNILNFVANFSVLPFTYLSDHCPIKMVFSACCSSDTIKKAKSTKQSTSKYIHKPEQVKQKKFIWKKESAMLFCEALENEESKSILKSFADKRIQHSELGINNAVNELTSVYISAAKQSLKLVTVKSKTKKKRWFDESCKDLKRSVHDSRNKWMKNPSNLSLRLQFFSLRKRYKK